MTTTRTPRRAPALVAPAPRRTPAALLLGLGAAALLLLLTVGVPLVMVRIGAYPHGRIDPAGLWDLLLRPGDGGVTLGLAAGVWACWAVFTADVLREIAAAVRTRGALVRPRRGSPFAGVATQLVQAVAVLFLAAPVALSVAHPAAAAGAGVSVPAMISRVVDPDVADSASQRAADSPVTPTSGVSRRATSSGTSPESTRDPRPAALTVTVKRHDTLWRLIWSEFLSSGQVKAPLGRWAGWRLRGCGPHRRGRGQRVVGDARSC